MEITTLINTFISLISTFFNLAVQIFNVVVYMINLILWAVTHLWVVLSLIEIFILGLCISKPTFSDMVYSLVNYHFLLFKYTYLFLIEFVKLFTSAILGPISSLSSLLRF